MRPCPVTGHALMAFNSCSNRATDKSDNIHSTRDELSSSFQPTVTVFSAFPKRKRKEKSLFFFPTPFSFYLFNLITGFWKVCLDDWWLTKAENDFHGKRLAIAGFTSREWYLFLCHGFLLFCCSCFVSKLPFYKFRTFYLFILMSYIVFLIAILC